MCFLEGDTNVDTGMKENNICVYTSLNAQLPI